jgi:tetratricopeptide (TPR) repeat protein
MRERAKKLIASAAVVSLISLQAAGAVFAQVASEVSTLNSWKSGAKGTQLGYQLLQLLEGSNRALTYNPRDKGALYRRGYLYGTIGCTQSAINDLTSAIQLDPYLAAAYTERGICYMDQKNYQNALYDLNRAVQLDPRSGDALFARGRANLASGKTQLALADFRATQWSVMKFHTTLPGELPANHYDAPNYYLGACYEAMDKPDEALKYYKASSKTPQTGTVGFLHRYADQPLDTKYRISSLERTGY